MEKPMEDTIVPVVMFLSAPVIIWVLVYFRFKAKAEFQQTVRLALEKGNELSPELMAHIGEPQPNEHRDLRRGLIWLALSVGTVALAFGVDDEDALNVLLAVATFPFSIGIAFLIMWRFGSGQKNQS